MYVCACECACVSMVYICVGEHCVCMHACMSVCVCDVCMCTHVCTCTCVYAGMCMYDCAFALGNYQTRWPIILHQYITDKHLNQQTYTNQYCSEALGTHNRTCSQVHDSSSIHTMRIQSHDSKLTSCRLKCSGVSVSGILSA